MPATAPLEKLIEVRNELEALKMKHPDAYRDFVDLFKKSRVIGYKNISLMLMGEKTPEELKS